MSRDRVWNDTAYGIRDIARVAGRSRLERSIAVDIERYKAWNGEVTREVG